MPNLYLVLSAPPEGVSAETYDTWYHHHIRENLEAPGFVAGQRFRLTPAVAKSGPAPAHTHLALYEYEGELARWRTDLETRIASGDIVLPPWFDRIGFGSWECDPVDERVIVPEG
jgi:hypothetical protein